MGLGAGCKESRHRGPEWLGRFRSGRALRGLSAGALAGVVLSGCLGWNTQFQETNTGLRSTAISCPSAKVCFATAHSTGRFESSSILATTDGGATWVHQTLPTASYPISSISCPDDLDCFAATDFGSTFGPGVLVFTHDGGSSWTEKPAFNAVNFLAISCPDNHHCFAAGAASAPTGDNPPVIAATTDGGATWSTVYTATMPSGWSGQATAISCPTTQNCWMASSSGPSTSSTVGQQVDVLATTDGGMSWHHQALPSNALSGSSVGSRANGLSCSTTSDCVAVGAYTDIANPALTSTPLIAVTHDGGATWTGNLPPGSGGTPLAKDVTDALEFFEGVSCPDQLHCYAAGRRASGSTVSATAVTTDGGTTWAAQAVAVPTPHDFWEVAGVSCPTLTSCWGAGTAADSSVVAWYGFVINTTDGGVATQP